MGVSSIFKTISSTVSLVMMLPTLDMKCEENTVRRKWKLVCVNWTHEESRTRSVSRCVYKDKRPTNSQCNHPDVPSFTYLQGLVTLHEFVEYLIILFIFHLMTLLSSPFIVVVVIYYHSKVFMVQATRLYYYAISLIRVVGSAVREWVCVCVCVCLFLRGVTLWSPPSICVCNKVCLYYSTPFFSFSFWNRILFGCQSWREVMRGGEGPSGLVSIWSWSPLFFGCPLILVLYMPFR
jgi:hypothetical protein